MSDPRDLPARVSLPQTKEISTSHFTQAWTGGGVSHAACIVDETGRIVARLDVRRDGSSLGDMAVRLQRIAPPAELPVAIERPSGLIVDALLAGGKCDRGDAYMQADILRTDGHRFRPLIAVSDEIKALRAPVRGRDDLVARRVALANQFRSLLEGFWPGATAIFAAIDSPIALAFIGRYPPQIAPAVSAPRQLPVPARLQRASSGRRAVGPPASSSHRSRQ